MESLGQLPEQVRPSLRYITPVCVDRRRTTLLREVLEPLREVKSDMVTPIIPVSSAVPLAYTQCQTLYEYAPGNRVTHAYECLAQYLLETDVEYMPERTQENAGLGVRMLLHGQQLETQSSQGSEEREEPAASTKEDAPRGFTVRLRPSTVERFRRMARQADLPQDEVMRVLLDTFDYCVRERLVAFKVRCIPTSVVRRAEITLGRYTGEGSTEEDHSNDSES